MIPISGLPSLAMDDQILNTNRRENEYRLAGRMRAFLVSVACIEEGLFPTSGKVEPSHCGVSRWMKITDGASPFIGTPPSISRHVLPYRRLDSTGVKLSFHKIPPIHSMDSSIDFNANVRKSEGLLYTLADAMVAVDSTSGAADATAPQKNGGWFGFISDGMEFVLKEGNSHGNESLAVIQVLKDGLSAVHVPYPYGVAIILLTFIVN
ncbi:inner membrane protein PPF-1 chloroplastic [Tripterygium wilfordii]|uniref:Inner membrane protein PPF-1 chloroplastic n=1 Tax=Tripterygium wilfordii TaxID=458696 RepID=A0A7J7DYU2_TRIWF|nr:inner membrane protein PPF-1 chloroplastic [Tripterygium wilfordii]